MNREEGLGFRKVYVNLICRFDVALTKCLTYKLGEESFFGSWFQTALIHQSRDGMAEWPHPSWQEHEVETVQDTEDQ